MDTVYNKITVNGKTLIDISSDTVDAEHLMQGYTAHDSSGVQITGTATEGSGTALIVDTTDSHGGIIREITTDTEVKLEGAKTVTPTSSRQTITPSQGYDGFSSVVIDAEGRPDLTEPKDVDFIDYDGRLVYSYTATEFMELTALPANPTNAGLVAQGWNWTLADAQDFVEQYGALVVGQNYTTDNGRTRIYIHIPQYPTEYRTIQIWFTVNIANGVRIYWGDGTNSLCRNNANTNASTEHTYNTYGDHIIELEPLEGSTITYLGRTGANTTIVGNEPKVCYWVNKIEIGDNVTGLAQNTFKFLRNLKSISIPITITTLNDYDEAMFHNGFSGGVVFPINLTTNRYRAMFPSNSQVRYISIPKGMKNFHIGTYPVYLRKLTMCSMEPYAGTNMTVKLYDVPQLTHFVVMGTYTNIQTDSCRGSLVKKLFIPSTVTNIAQTAFAYNPLLEEVHLYSESPPILARTNAFQDLPATCTIYVPYSSDHSILEAYKAATNWSTYASQMQEEPQS